MPTALAARPWLLASILAGAAAEAILALAAPGLRQTTRGILSWDLACALFLGLSFIGMRGRGPADMRARAADQDAGAGVILLMTLLAAGASLGAIVVELSGAKGGHGLVAGLRVGLAFLTVALSWTLVQVNFALHYAHEYYGGKPGPPDNDVRGGLGFPGKGTPDYWDFLHFAVVIGVASQTADITFTSKTMRRTGTLHSVVAFVFNTLVLALSINLAAGLF